METSNENEHIEKSKAFYNALLSAWLNTKLEHDKQLLALSSTAIGLLVTLIRTMGVSDILQLGLYSSALIAFLITIVSVIYILGENSLYIENILNGVDARNIGLRIADSIARASFILGVVLVIIIGINSAVYELINSDIFINQEHHIEFESQQMPSESNDTRSWDGVERLRPKPSKPQPANPDAPSTGNASKSSHANESGSNENTKYTG